MTKQQMIDYLRENGYEVYSKEEDEERENDFFHLSEDYKQNVIEKCKLRKELKEIKKKFESGQAVILPCKVGDTFYTIRRMKVNEEKVYEITTNGRYFGIVDMKSEWYHQNEVYHTREAAEAKLKELKGE